MQMHAADSNRFYCHCALLYSKTNSDVPAGFVRVDGKGRTAAVRAHSLDRNRNPTNQMGNHENSLRVCGVSLLPSRLEKVISWPNAQFMLRNSTHFGRRFAIAVEFFFHLSSIGAERCRLQLLLFSVEELLARALRHRFLLKKNNLFGK